MKVGCIQIIRGGQHDNELIEGSRVWTWIKVPPSADDIRTQGSTYQWERIAKKLRDLGNVRGQNSISCSASPDYSSHKSLYVIVARNDTVNFVVRVSGVGRVSLFCNNRFVTGRNIEVSPVVSTFNVPYTVPPPRPIFLPRAIVPCVFQVQKDGMTLFKVKRTLRIVPGRFLITSTATKIDLLAPSNEYAIDNNLAPEFGWKIGANSLSLGDGVRKYEIFNKSTIFFFFSALPVGRSKARLDIVGKYFIFLSIIFDDQEENYEKDVSCADSSQGCNFAPVFFEPIGAFTIGLKFQSDGIGNKLGVFIDAMTLIIS
jgi:hypothetical protein